MIPCDPRDFVYLGYRELTEEDKRRADEEVESFKRAFLRPGAVVRRRSQE
ncbi:MAG: hypothetical protein IKK56_03320 [Methanocorpusculum sp.]|nr:hypothetical protein [Methanocorpusculum sp.]